MNDARNKLGAFQSSLGGLGSSLAKLGAAFGLASVGKQVVTTAVDMEKAMVGLQKASDLNPEGLAKLKAQLVNLSTTLKGVSVESLLDIATSGAKLGIAKEDLVQYTEGIAKLSTAMDDIPASEIADSVGKINNIFRLGVGGAMQLGSAIDKVADSGVSSSSGILDVTQRTSGLAKAVGLTAQETIALSGALLDTGTESEAAAGAINKLLAKLNDTNQQADFAKAMGISVKEFASMVKDKPMKAIQGFLGAVSKMDSGSAQKAFGDLGVSGVRDFPNLMKLAQQSGTVAKYTGYANSEFRTLNQITQSYNATAKTTGALWTQTTNFLKSLADTIGQAVLPGINSLLAGTQQVATWAKAAFADTFLPGLQAIGERIAPTSQAIADGLGGAFNIVLDALDLLGVAWRNFPDFIEIGVMRVQELLSNAGSIFVWLRDTITSVLGYIHQLWFKSIDEMSSSWAAFRDGLLGTKNPVTEDMRKALELAGQGKVKQAEAMAKKIEDSLPKLPELKLDTSTSDEIQKKIEAIGQRDAAHTEEMAKRRADLLVPFGGGKGPAMPGVATPTAELDDTKRKFAAAAELGSKEAYSSIAKAKAGADSGAQQAVKQRDAANKLLARIADATAKLAGGAGIGAAIPIDI